MEPHRILESIELISSLRPFAADLIGDKLGLSLVKDLSASNDDGVVYRSAQSAGGLLGLQVTEPREQSQRNNKGGIVVLEIAAGCITKRDIGNRFGPCQPGPPSQSSSAASVATLRYECHQQRWGELRLGYDPSSEYLVSVVLEAHFDDAVDQADAANDTSVEACRTWVVETLSGIGALGESGNAEAGVLMKSFAKAAMQWSDTLSGTQISKDLKSLSERVRLASKFMAPGIPQFTLGRLYRLGTVLDCDQDQAVAWYTQAASLGHEPSKRCLKEMGVSSEHTESLEPRVLRSSGPLRPGPPPTKAGPEAIALWYSVAFMQLAWADGSIDSSESAIYEEAINAMALPNVWHVHGPDKLAGMYSDGSWHALGRELLSLPHRERVYLGKELYKVVLADGEAKDWELKKLADVLKEIGLTPEDLRAGANAEVVSQAQPQVIRGGVGGELTQSVDLETQSHWFLLAFLGLAIADQQITPNEMDAWLGAAERLGLPDVRAKFPPSELVQSMDAAEFSRLGRRIQAGVPQERRQAFGRELFQIVLADGVKGEELTAFQSTVESIGLSLEDAGVRFQQALTREEVAIWFALSYLKVACVDGVVTSSEEASFTSSLSRLELPDVLAKYGVPALTQMIRDGVDDRLTKRLDSIPRAMRVALGDALARIMVADESLAPSELAIILDLAKDLGLKPEEIGLRKG